MIHVKCEVRVQEISNVKLVTYLLSQYVNIKHCKVEIVMLYDYVELPNILYRVDVRIHKLYNS